MNKNVDIIGAQLDLGASQKGVSMGPLSIRHAGLIEELGKLGYFVSDKGDIIPPKEGKSLPKLLNYEQIKEVNQELFDEVSDTLSKNHVPVVLGGDHSIAAGSISAISKHYEKDGPIGVIWIDAHGDWNDETITESGNMHGMPFSAICGYGPNSMVDFGQKPCYVPVSNCVQVGGRDFDTSEINKMKVAGMNVFPIYAIDRRGMYDVMKEAIEIASRGTVGIHLSFDVDAITPEYAPGTGTPVINGITAREAFLAVEMLAETEKLLSIDMVEVNPILDDTNKTGHLASELILSAFGKSVY